MTKTSLDLRVLMCECCVLQSVLDPDGKARPIIAMIDVAVESSRSRFDKLMRDLRNVGKTQTPNYDAMIDSTRERIRLAMNQRN